MESKTDAEKMENKGLSLGLASVFIVGLMAGSGVLALPRAIADTGWSGVFLLFFCCMSTLYSGICLGRCWDILEERYEEYKEKNRFPYPAIAYRAVGVKMKYIVSFTIDFTCFGVATVFLLLSAQMISNLATKWEISFCYWILILALILWPLMWLGTPEDFWPAAVIAMGTTGAACLLLLVAMGQEMEKANAAEYPSPDVLSFFLAFGTILFSFGGAASFPTFQNDMKDKSQFPKAAAIAFGVLLLLYTLVSVMGYAVYGNAVKSDVTLLLPGSGLKYAIQVLFAVHLVFAFLLAINAPAQEFEEFFNVLKKFCWQRIALRTCMMLLIIFIAQSIPLFGKVLNLVGSSTITLTASIFPCFFYIKLCEQENPEWPQRLIPMYEKVFLWIVMLVGAVGGCIGTYSAINDIAQPYSFNPPCYINITAAGKE